MSKACMKFPVFRKQGILARNREMLLRNRVFHRSTPFTSRRVAFEGGSRGVIAELGPGILRTGMDSRGRPAGDTRGTSGMTFNIIMIIKFCRYDFISLRLSH